MQIAVNLQQETRAQAKLQTALVSLGLNRTVVYSLVDSVDGTFSVDPVSGIVILERSLDRESRDSYRLRVQATDQAGQEGALSSQVGFVRVMHSCTDMDFGHATATIVDCRDCN